ncbi:MAG: hypothetical protein ACYC5O_05025 [Anaerolineae bacterium]
MKRYCLLVAAMVLALLTASLPAAAQGTCVPDFDLGGNGWCADGINFRAWQVEGGIELRWAVSDDGVDIAIERQVAGGAADAVVVATSTAAGEFIMLDEGVEPGPSYVYQVLRAGEAVGAPIEAGIGTTATDPGGASGGYRVFIPLTI